MCVRERECVCVCVRERVCVCVCERESVFVCLNERKNYLIYKSHSKIVSVEQHLEQQFWFVASLSLSDFRSTSLGLFHKRYFCQS